MNILAIDTAGDVLSAALSTPDGTKYEEADAVSRHSELLMEVVDGLFKSAGLKPGELDLAACMKGPGSFTGLRIGYATAKGLSLALGIPLAAVPTLDCLGRHLLARPGLVLPAMDAKKNSFFAAFYRRGILLSDYLDASAEALSGLLAGLRSEPNEPVMLTGPGAALLMERLSPRMPGLELDPLCCKGRAKELLDIAAGNPAQYREGEDSGPLYIRKSDAEISRFGI